MSWAEDRSTRVRVRVRAPSRPSYGAESSREIEGVSALVTTMSGVLSRSTSASDTGTPEFGVSNSVPPPNSPLPSPWKIHSRGFRRVTHDDVEDSTVRDIGSSDDVRGIDGESRPFRESRFASNPRPGLVGTVTELLAEDTYAISVSPSLSMFERIGAERIGAERLLGLESSSPVSRGG